MLVLFLMTPLSILRLLKDLSSPSADCCHIIWGSKCVYNPSPTPITSPISYQVDSLPFLLSHRRTSESISKRASKSFTVTAFTSVPVHPFAPRWHTAWHITWLVAWQITWLLHNSMAHAYIIAHCMLNYVHWLKCKQYEKWPVLPCKWFG